MVDSLGAKKVVQFIKKYMHEMFRIYILLNVSNYNVKCLSPQCTNCWLEFLNALQYLKCSVSEYILIAFLKL
jgi:hypothetical protein